VVGAIARDGADPDLPKEEAKKKADAHHADVEVALATSKDKSFKWNRKYTIGVGVLAATSPLELET
jgi:hypothetical protein